MHLFRLLALLQFACLLLLLAAFPADSQSITALRSTDPNVTDYSEIASSSLVSLLRSGSIDLLALGENCHGDGSSFLVKSRLIVELHKSMNLRYLLWETGLYDVEVTWRCLVALRAKYLSASASASAQLQSNSTGAAGLHCISLSIPALWFNVSETRFLFQFVADSILSDQPIRLLGFEVAGPSAAALYAGDLVTALESLNLYEKFLNSFSPDSIELFNLIVDRLNSNSYVNHSLLPSASELKVFNEIIEALVGWLGAEMKNSGNTRTPSPTEELAYNFLTDPSFWYNSVLTLNSSASMWWSLGRIQVNDGKLNEINRNQIEIENNQLLIEGMNIRDAAMGRNMVYHLEYSHRKIAIGWSHNGHFMGSPTVFSPIPAFAQGFNYNQSVARLWEPAGVYLRKSIGSRAYLVGGSAANGTCISLGGGEKAWVNTENPMYLLTLEYLSSLKIPVNSPAWIIDLRLTSDGKHARHRDEVDLPFPPDSSDYYTMATVDYQISKSKKESIEFAWDALYVVREQIPVTPIDSFSHDRNSLID